MRLGRFIILMGGLLAVAALFMAGCSDSSTPTNTSDNSSQEDVVSDRAEGLVDSTLTVAANALSMYLLASMDPDDPDIPVSYGSVNPDSTNSSDLWWIIYDGDIAAGYEYSLLDSVQFVKNGTPRLSAVGAEQMSIRSHVEIVAADTTANFHNYFTAGSYEIAGLNTDQAVVNGASTVTVEARETRSKRTVRSTTVISSTITDLAFNKGNDGWEDGCPASGTIEATVNMTYQIGENDPVESTWTVTVTFEDGVSTVHLVTENVDATVNRTICVSNPA